MRSPRVISALCAALAGLACAAGVPMSTGRVNIAVVGLPAAAVDGGSLAAAPAGGTQPPITLPLPPTGGGADVPPGTYHLSYTPPAGYQLAPGEVAQKDVVVVEAQSLLVQFAVEPLGSSLQVVVQGLGASATSGGSAEVARTDVPAVPVILTLPASGAVVVALAAGGYRVTYTTPAGYVLAPGQPGVQNVTLNSGQVSTVTFQVQAGVPAPSAYPNQPAGFTQLLDRGFAARNELGWVDAGTITFTTDGTAPPPGLVAEINFPVGWTALNGAPGESDHQLAGSPTRLYVSFWFWLDPSWQAPGAGHFPVILAQGGTSGFGFQLKSSVLGSGSGPLTAGIVLPNSSQLNPTSGQGTLSRSAWHQWELLLTMNATAGTADGAVQWWVDGVTAGNQANVELAPFGEANLSWVGIRWHPVWQGSASVMSAQRMRVDHLYVSRGP